MDYKDIVKIMLNQGLIKKQNVFSFNFLKLTATTANFLLFAVVVLVLLYWYCLVGNFYPMLRVIFSSI